MGREHADVLLGNGDGTFSPRTALPTIPSPGWTPSFPGAAAVADFNGDGKLDMLVAEQNSNSPGDNAVVMFPGNANGTFGTPLISNEEARFGNPSGDFSGDGKPDLALANGGGLGVALGNGDGTFGPLNNTYPAAPRDFVTGDFHGDSKQDMVVLGDGFSHSPTDFRVSSVPSHINIDNMTGS